MAERERRHDENGGPRAEPEAGSQPSPTLKTRIISSPSQNEGIAMPITASVCAIRSSVSQFGCRAATTPSGKATASARMSAETPSVSVIGDASANISVTGRR